MASDSGHARAGDPGFSQDPEAGPWWLKGRPQLLAAAGTELFERFRRSGDVGALNRAIAALHRAVGDPSLSEQERVGYLAALDAMLAERFSLSGGLGDLSQVIAADEQAVAVAPRGSDLWYQSRIDLGIHLQARHHRSSDSGDLDRGIEILEEALKEAQPDSQRRAIILCNLGLCLRDRHTRTGKAADLDRAIEAFSASVADPTLLSPEQRVGMWSNLGLGLSDRFLRDGDLGDLQRAVELLQAALTPRAEDGASRAIPLNTLGLALRDRYKHLDDPRDIDRAVQAHEQAAASARGRLQRGVFLNNLGGSLLLRYRDTADLTDLDRAVAAFEQSVEATPPGAADRARHLLSLAEGLRVRYERVRAFPDLDRAVEVAEQALTEVPAASFDRPAALAIVAESFRMRYIQLGHQDDLRRAVETFSLAGREALSTRASIALVATRHWAHWAAARGAWAQAAEAGALAVEAMQQLFRTQLGRQDKEVWLREAEGIGALAAYGQAMAGEPAKGVLALEATRALLLTEALERDRAELNALVQAGSGDLVDRYRQAADQWRELARSLDAGRAAQPAPVATAPTAEPASLDAASVLTSVAQSDRALRAARAELEASIAAIHEVAGFEQFLDPPGLHHVQAAADPAPLVYLAATDPGGVAFVMKPTAGAEPLASIWLPDLTADAVRARIAAFRTAHARRRQRRGAWQGSLDELTAWLWNAAMARVLDGLGDAPAAVLIPVGLLSVLPLHAAWTQDASRPTGRSHVLDRLCISYAPNARSMRTARAAASRAGERSLLAVQEPRPSVLGPLPFTVPEVMAISTYFESARILVGEQATLEEVQAALGAKSIHHFACHGLADVGSPLESAIFLAHDQPLTLRSLLELRLPNSGAGGNGIRLAVLSACETQVPGLELPDEVMSLPTGLLQAGVAGVIASQWAVSGAGTAMLMARFYDGWMQEQLEPAAALRAAQLWLRDSTNEQKAAWFRAVAHDDQDRAATPSPVRLLWQAVARKEPAARDHAHVSEWGAFVHVGA
jgi:CHAT domain-containing protein